MTLDEAKKDLEKFVKLKTTLRPAFVDVLLNAEEVKHGHWFQMMGHAYCSVCGYKGSPIITNYCPNCGTKMDEVKE